jgi:hypothetical protein
VAGDADTRAADAAGKPRRKAVGILASNQNIENNPMQSNRQPLERML